MCGLDMMLKLLAFDPCAVLQRITLRTLYPWWWHCSIQRSFLWLFMDTIMWPFHVNIEESPLSSVFKPVLVPSEMTVYATFLTNHNAPKWYYFQIDLRMSVNFFKPPVCSNNVPITKPSAPALIMALAVFADLMPPPTMINPSNTALTV